METIALSIGSNLGDRHHNINEMESRLADLLIPPIRFSTLMETEPIHVADKQPWYLNRIITGNFNNSPEALLECTQLIENELGRVGKGENRARTADIDILLFGNAIITTERLHIPHPALLKRHFVLKGLRECIPEFSVALYGRKVEELYNGNLSNLASQNVRLLHEGGANE